MIPDSLLEIVKPNKPIFTPLKVQPVDIFTPQEIEHILDIKRRLYAELITGFNTVTTSDRIVIAGGAVPHLVNNNPDFNSDADFDSDIDYFILLGDNSVKLEDRLHETYNYICERRCKTFLNMIMKDLDQCAKNSNVTIDLKNKPFTTLSVNGTKTSYHHPHVFKIYECVVNGIKHQFIFSRFATRNELLDSFDFLHCTASYQLGKLYISRRVYDAILKKELRMNTPKSVIKPNRVKKYEDRGYKNCLELPVLNATQNS